MKKFRDKPRLFQRYVCFMGAAAVTLLPDTGIAREQKNQLLIDDSGQTYLLVTDDKPLSIFEEEHRIPVTGGVFSKEDVWADRGDIRITTLKHQCLVFVAGKRVETIDLDNVRESLRKPAYTFSEYGFTLRVWVQKKIKPKAKNIHGEIKIKVQVTRP